MALLFTLAKLCAQEESWSLVCMWEMWCQAVRVGDGAPWESDVAAQESDTPGPPGSAQCPACEQMRRHPQGVGTSQPRSGSWSFGSSESDQHLLYGSSCVQGKCKFLFRMEVFTILRQDVSLSLNRCFQIRLIANV